MNGSERPREYINWKAINVLAVVTGVAITVGAIELSRSGGGDVWSPYQINARTCSQDTSEPNHGGSCRIIIEQYRINKNRKKEDKKCIPKDIIVSREVGGIFKIGDLLIPYQIQVYDKMHK